MKASRNNNGNRRSMHPDNVSLVILSMCALFLLTGLSAATSSAQTSMTLTLEEAIRIGLEQSNALKISAAKVDGASAKAGEAGAGLLPSLKLTAGYTRLSDVDPFRVSVPIFPQPITISPTVLNNYNVRATLQQPLFTGFRLESNASAAERLSKASEFDNRNDKADLVLNITSAYWTMYQTIETKTFADENVSRLESFQNDTQNLLKAGMATRNDLLKIQVQLNNAKLVQIDAANDVQLATMTLNNVMSQPLETAIQLTSRPALPADPEGKPARDSDGQMGLTAKALTARPDLLAMQSRIEAAKASVHAAQGNWWPQVFLNGNYYYSRPNVRYQPTKDEFKDSWDVGVQLQFDVWNWGATSFQTEQARAALTQTEFAYEQMKNNVSLDVRRQSLAVHRAREKVEVAQLAIAQAEENARTTQDKFKQGLATSSELLDANVALLQAKTNFSGALVESEVAKARLKRSVGSDN